MSLFSSILKESEMSSSEDKSNVDGEKDKNLKEVVKDSDSVTKKRKSSSSSGSAEKSKKIDNGGASSSKSSERKKSETDNEGLAKLGEIMKGCFSNMQKSIETMGNNIAEKVAEQFDQEEFEEISDDELPANEENPTANENLFKMLTESLTPAETTGPAITIELAKLVNNLLSSDPSEEISKARVAKHLRPINCDFVAAPKVNKQVWNALSTQTKAVDKSLQEIQKEFLSSVIPICKVMEILNKSVIENSPLHVPDMVRLLADSIAFIGTANMGMVKRRKEQIKKELPTNLQGLCSSSGKFSGEHLFGEAFMEDLKELNECNKITGVLKKTPAIRGRSWRGSNNSGERGYKRSGYKRGYYPRSNYKSSANYRGRSNSARGRLNYRRSSGYKPKQTDQESQETSQATSKQ